MRSTTDDTSNVKTSSVKTYENGIILLLFLTFGFLFMDRLSITFLFPFIKQDLHITQTEVGLLVSILSITWAVSGYVFSSVSDLVGSRKKILVPTTIAFSLFSFMSGLARTFSVLLLARGLMGASEGPVLPLAQATAAEESTPARRGFNMGFLQSSSALLGSTLGPLVVTWLAIHYSWHAAFFLVGVPGLVLAALLWKFMKDRKGARTPAAERTQHKRISMREYLQVFKVRNIWLCVVISICLMTWLFAYSSFAPDYFVETGYSPGEESLIMAAIGLGQFGWMIVVPTISDKLGRKPTLVIFAFLAVVGPVVFAVTHLPVGMAAIVGFLLMTGSGVFPLFMVVIPSEAISAGLIATSVGLVQLVGELGGGTVMPSVSGWASDTFGLSAPLWIAAGGAFIAALLGFGLTETAPKRQKSVRTAPLGSEV